MTTSDEANLSLIDDSMQQNQLLLRRLRRSIRSSIAASSRSSSWNPKEIMREVSEFGETLEYRNEELGYNLGRNRIEARRALQEDLDTYVTPYETHFYGYLTVAEHINTESATNWRVSTRSHAKLDVLCELHSQALIVAEEVVTLISAGLPTGATARWRTLYEITVTALFIAKSPNMVAERYKHSHIVEPLPARMRQSD